MTTEEIRVARLTAPKTKKETCQTNAWFLSFGLRRLKYNLFFSWASRTILLETSNEDAISVRVIRCPNVIEGSEFTTNPEDDLMFSGSASPSKALRLKVKIANKKCGGIAF